MPTSSIEKPQRIFFPALNAIRAYAALGVVLWHMRQLMMLFRVPIAEPLYEKLFRCFPRGDDGVMLFFVLSGFLITYLLLTEQDRTGTIAVGKFYVRRILRIWPLYYLLVIIGFSALTWNHEPFLQHDHVFFPRLAFYTLLLPNVSMVFYPGAIPIGHLWSIGVEEQFYLLWPALMKWFARRALWVILGVIAVKALSYYLESALLARVHSRHHRELPEVLSYTFRILHLLRLDCMAVGGLGAYVAFHAGRWGIVQWIYHPVTALLALSMMAWSISTAYRRPETPYGGIAHAGIFAGFILCVGANPNLPRWLILGLTPIDYVGRISYGVYMYHVPVMFCLLKSLQKHQVTWHTGFQYVKGKHGMKVIAPAVNSAGRNVSLLLVVLAITLAIATISFYLFERPFLTWKRRFTVIRSGSPETSLLPQPTEQPAV